MKKKVIISLIIIFILLMIFGTGFVIFSYERDKQISLIQDDVVIEYGNCYNPKIEELINLSKYNFIDLDKVRIENNIENELEKEYPAVGKYEISIKYKNIVLKQRIEVVDTVAPDLEIEENIEIEYNTDLSTIDFGKYLKITDLSKVNDFSIDLSKINSSISGEQITNVSIEDIYGNKTEKELKIKVLEKVEEKPKENTIQEKQTKTNNSSASSKPTTSTKKENGQNKKNTVNSPSNQSGNIQNNNSNNNLSSSIINKEEPIWCDEGGKKHWQGTGTNEHGYYKTWDAAWAACQSYMEKMKSGNYAVRQCACGLFYYWVEEN